MELPIITPGTFVVIFPLLLFVLVVLLHAGEAPEFELHGYQIDYLRKLAKAQGKSIGAALQSIVESAINDTGTREEIFGNFWCVHCMSVNPPDWIKSRKGKKTLYPIEVSSDVDQFLSTELLKKVQKVGSPAKYQVVDGPLWADKNKAARMCIDWAIKKYGPDASKATKAQ